MNFLNKLARLSRDTGPARFLVPAGIILIVIGIVMLGFKTDGFVETTGRITAVEACAPQEDQPQQYDVYFTFTADGKEYNNSFSNMSGEYKTDDEIKVFYDPENPEKVTNTKGNGFIGAILIAAGAAAAALGVFLTVKALKKSKALDKTAAGTPSAGTFSDFKTAPGVTEYYFRYDGNALKPGYLIEDAGRNVLFEGKMLKNALVGARTFEFTDRTNGSVKQHEVGHRTTTSFSNEIFSVKSSFKFDSVNVWDALHDRGLRIQTDPVGKFPRLVYNVTKNGAAFARIETSSIYVHEDDEAQHALALPTGSMYYRFWTASGDFDTLFLTIFAISESEQTMVE